MIWRNLEPLMCKNNLKKAVVSISDKPKKSTKKYPSFQVQAWTISWESYFTLLSSIAGGLNYGNKF
jgi:predicted transcriptional regulator